MKIKLLVDAGAMKPGPALSQKLGPLGINLGRVVGEVNKATQNYSGMKVPVILDIDVKTKNFTVEVLTPPAAELLKKELGIEKGSPQPDKIKVGNAAFEQIIKIAKEKQAQTFTSLKETVKSVIGTCISMGVLIESKDPREVQEEVAQGLWDELIEKEVTEPSKEKLEKLNAEFEKVKKEQEALVKEIIGEGAGAGAEASTASGAGSEEKEKK